MHRLSNMAALTTFSLVGALVIYGCASGPAAQEVSTGEADQSPIGASALALKPSATYQDRAGKAETKLKGIEAKLDKITTQKKATNKDAEELDQTMREYAQNMKDAFDTAKSEAEEASNTKGAKGNVDSIQAFEDMAKKHEQRTNKVKTRVEDIEDKIKKGEIKREAAPGRGPTGMLAPEIEGAERAAEASGACVAGDVVGCDGDLSSVVDGPVGEQAEPFLAAGCVLVCKAKNWAACVACVVAAGTEAVAAWNTFISCWNSCSCAWYNPLCCAKKAGCLAIFIAKLA